MACASTSICSGAKSSARERVREAENRAKDARRAKVLRPILCLADLVNLAQDTFETASRTFMCVFRLDGRVVESGGNEVRDLKLPAFTRGAAHHHKGEPRGPARRAWRP